MPGTFTTPIVKNASTPALYGLQSMVKNRALLDCEGKKLYHLGEGEYQLILPPGTEVFELESAPSGHLVLPISNYAALEKSIGQRTTGEEPKHIVMHSAGSSSSHRPVDTTSVHEVACGISHGAEPPTARL